MHLNSDSEKEDIVNNMVEPAINVWRGKKR